MKVIRLNEPGKWESFQSSELDNTLLAGEALIKVKKIGSQKADRWIDNIVLKFPSNDPNFFLSIKSYLDGQKARQRESR